MNHDVVFKSYIDWLSQEPTFDSDDLILEYMVCHFYVRETYLCVGLSEVIKYHGQR